MDLQLVQLLTNFGAIGVILILMITGVIVPYTVVRRLERTLEKREQELELQQGINKALATAAETAMAAMNTLKEIALEHSSDKSRRDV